MADGSINIDTKINEGGFNKGIEQITGAVSGMAQAIGIAFGVDQIIQFGKGAVDAASQMSNALIGLQSILNGQGRSFQDAKKFIDSYIADGLVPASNAITAYKNLASRGYSDDQIQKTMTALKDSAAFGRQASYSLGDAVESATEGLKNENSILVDNAGVTKNVAKMWEDYAKAHGKAAAQLTKEEKILAETSGIMEESKFQVGDAAKVAQTYSGKMAALGASFQGFKTAVGNAIIPAVAMVIPYITQLVNWLTSLASTFAQVTSALFGNAQAASMQQAASSTSEAATAQDDLAKSTDKATKAAKGSLAAFDELNVLQQNKVTPAETTAAAAVTPVASGAVADVIPQGVLDQVAQFRDAVLEMLAPLAEPFERLKAQIFELGGTIWDGLKWAWENILVPFGTWLITAAAPVFIDLLAAAVNTLNGILIAVQPALIWLWDNFLKPVAEWTGQAFLDALGWITDRLNELATWIRTNPDQFMAVFGGALLGLVSPMGILTGNFDNFKATSDAVFGFITSLWQQAGPWFDANVVQPVSAFFTNLWATIQQNAGAAWANIQGVWGIITTWFTDNVITPLQTAFESFLAWFPGAWQTAFDGIASFVKGSVNTIIDFVNGMINAIVGGINAAIGGLNSLSVTIPEWIPGLGGQSWGLNIPSVSAPQIPRLATGAVIPGGSAFAAILGDQPSGQTNIEAPADLIRQIVREELGGIKADIKIEFGGSLGALVRELRPYIDKENIRIGGKLIQGMTPT